MNSIAVQKQEVLRVISSCVSAEMIYELGFQSSDYKTTSIFDTSSMSYSELTHYYLLVLIPKGENLRPIEVQDKIENSCRAIVPVTVLVIFFEDFKRIAGKGHRFALLVITNACSVYTKSSSTHIPQVENMPSQLVESGEIWTKEYNKVNELLKGAEFYLEYKQVHMALFMAHHAAISLLHYVFRKSTGLSLQTHNLDKLVRFNSLVSSLPQQLFPKQTEKDIRLYSILYHAGNLFPDIKTFKPTASDITAILEKLRSLRMQSL